MTRGHFGESRCQVDGHGLLLQHGAGNVFVRDMAPGETRVVGPTACG